MLQMYLDPCTVNSCKVLAGLDLIGLPYELKHVDYFSGAHKKPNFWRSTRTGQYRRLWTEIWHFRSPTRSCSAPQI
jgi:glutathione S-transferase